MMVNQVLKDRVWEEVANNWTPDMPALRYSGPIPVILSGSLADAGTFASWASGNKLTMSRDWTTESFRVLTKNKYCAYKNMGGLLGDVSVPDFVFPKFDDVVMEGGLTPRQIRGRLITCGLKTISLLDAMYYNTVIFDRIKVKLEDNTGGPYKEAYMYLVRKTKLFEERDDGVHKHYWLKKGVNMRPYLVEKVGERSAYF